MTFKQAGIIASRALAILLLISWLQLTVELVPLLIGLWKYRDQTGFWTIYKIAIAPIWLIELLVLLFLWYFPERFANGDGGINEATVNLRELEALVRRSLGLFFVASGVPLVFASTQVTRLMGEPLLGSLYSGIGKIVIGVLLYLSGVNWKMRPGELVRKGATAVWGPPLGQEAEDDQLDSG